MVLAAQASRDGGLSRPLQHCATRFFVPRAFVIARNMAWEERGGHRYYYQSRRVDGRVVKEYVGPEGSPLANLAALMDEEGRQSLEEEARTLKAERERLAAPIEELCEAAEIL